MPRIPFGWHQENIPFHPFVVIYFYGWFPASCHIQVVHEARSNKDQNRSIGVRLILDSECRLFRALCSCAGGDHYSDHTSSTRCPYLGIQTIRLDSPFCWSKCGRVKGIRDRVASLLLIYNSPENSNVEVRPAPISPLHVVFWRPTT